MKRAAGTIQLHDTVRWGRRWYQVFGRSHTLQMRGEGIMYLELKALQGGDVIEIRLDASREVESRERPRA